MNKPIELIDEITVNDMPTEDLKTIADLCGIEVALKIIETFSGCNIYIPTRGYKILICRYIKANYDGTTKSIKEFAKKFGVSDTYIYNVLRKK